MKKNFLLAAFTLSTATIASALLSTSAKASEANVNIEVDIPNVVFLETYTTLTFKPTLSDLTGGASTDGKFATQTATVEGLTSPTVTPALGGVTGPTLTSANKTYTDVPVYKIWGLGGTDGEIRHKISYDETSTLTKGNNNSTIAWSVTGNDATGQAVTAPGLNYADAIEQKLNFIFNFKDVKESGLHTGGILTITATAE